MTYRLYGCTCGQVMYYLTHYYVPGDHTYITILVRCAFLSTSYTRTLSDIGTLRSFSYGSYDHQLSIDPPLMLFIGFLIPGRQW